MRRFVKIIFLLAVTGAFAPARGEVYLTKEEALKLVLGEDTEHTYVRSVIPRELGDEIVRQGFADEAPKVAHFFEARKNGVLSGIALIDSEIGKHLPITYIVGISPAGKVTRVEMMVFREIRGWEARERRFMAQFEGKSSGDRLAVGDTLRNVTGATLSSRAIARGVKRALMLWEHFYRATAKEENA